jgi:transposase
MSSMKPYSEDLRERIVKALEAGTSKSGAARLFGVSLSSVKRYARIADREETLSNREKAAEDRSRPIRSRRSCSKRTSRNVLRPP